MYVLEDGWGVMGQRPARKLKGRVQKLGTWSSETRNVDSGNWAP